MQHDCDAGLEEELKKVVLNDILVKITSNDCQQCDDLVRHMNRVKVSRTQYRKDADSDPECNSFYLSGDMQKVIMLPRLPGVKTVVFTRRITLYHETFAPLVPSKEKRKEWREAKKPFKLLKPLGMIWHEAIQGRNDEDVCSSVVKLLHHPQYRDANKITVWADNCSGQLKNWSFYGCLVRVVNVHGSISEVTIKYFEKGHSFMLADSFHHQVEEAMRKKKNLYDFADFSQCVSKSGIAVEMTVEDFFDFRNNLSSGKDTFYRYLKDVSVARLGKGTIKFIGRRAIWIRILNRVNLL